VGLAEEVHRDATPHPRVGATPPYGGEAKRKNFHFLIERNKKKKRVHQKNSQPKD